MLAVYLAVARGYRRWLAPGEVATIMLIASDRAQARTLIRYVTGLVDSVPALAREVVERKQESLSFGRVVIEVHTASFRTGSRRASCPGSGRARLRSTGC